MPKPTTCIICAALLANLEDAKKTGLTLLIDTAQREFDRHKKHQHNGEKLKIVEVRR